MATVPNGRANRATRPDLPLRTPLYDDQGNLTRPWIAYLQQAAIRKYATDFQGETDYTAAHNLNTSDVIVSVWDQDGNQLIPQTCQVVSVNAVEVTFAAAQSGRIVVIG